MNTDLTQADVVAWFASHLPANLAGKISVGYDSSYHKKFTASTIPYGSVSTKFADTPQEAVALLIADIKTPEQLAAEKRAEAAKLLADADALSPLPMAASAAPAKTCTIAADTSGGADVDSRQNAEAMA